MKKKQHTPIFNEIFLKQEIDKHWDVVKSSIPNIIEIKESLIKWIEQEPHIIPKKEEEVSPTFIRSIFSDSLGYLFSYSQERNSVPEKKTDKDGKKSDLALGYFHEENEIVLVVIELKDAKKGDLDKLQGGAKYKFSPVDQAFNYSHRHNGSCKWVIVSNFLEIRLYRVNDSIKYERFVLQDIQDCDYQFKKFIFLLHKDNLIAKNRSSRVDTLYYENKELQKIEQKNKQNIHIIDQLFTFFEKFKGFSFINPYFIAECEPFHKIRIQNQSYYSNYSLYSNNSEVFNFFEKVTILPDGNIELQSELKQELTEKKVKDFGDKTKYILDKLNNNLIHDIKSHDIYKVKKVSVKLPTKNIYCDNLRSNFESFEFDKLITKLNNLKGKKVYSLDEAYMFSKIPIDDYKWAYKSYKSIRIHSKYNNDQNSLLLATYNLKNLSSYFRYDYEGNDREEIFKELQNIDLHYLIHYSLDYTTDKDIRDYYLQVIENNLFYRIQNNVDEITEKINDYYNQYKHDKKPFSTPSNEDRLLNQFDLLISYNKQNSLAYDRLSYFENIIYKIFKGYVISYATSDKYENKISSFDFVLLINAIIYIKYERLKKIFNDYGINKIGVGDKTYNKLINVASNLLQSVYKKGFYNNQNPEMEYMLSKSRFHQDFNNYYNNLFLILNKIEIKTESFKIINQHIYPFIKYYKKITHFNRYEFLNFIYINGDLFSYEELLKLYEIAIDYENGDLVKCVSISIKNHHPATKIKDKAILYKILSVVISDDAEYTYKQSDYLSSFEFLSDPNKKIFLSELSNKLNDKFNFNLYQDLVLLEIIDLQNKKWFKQFSIDLYNTILNWYKYENVCPDFFITSVQIFYIFNIFEDKQMQIFKDLPDFDTWLINPYLFNYEKFSVEWLYRVNYESFMDKLKHINILKNKIVSFIRENPTNNKLLEIYFKYFI